MGDIPYAVYVLVSIIMFVVGGLIGFLIQGYIYRSKIGSVDEYLKKRKEDLENQFEIERRSLQIQMKEELEKRSLELENKFKGRQREVQELENRLLKKDEIVDRRAQFLDKKEKDLSKKKKIYLDLKRVK